MPLDIHNCYYMQITIPGELTNLNDYIQAERSNRYVAAKIKRHDTSYVCWQAKGTKLPAVAEYPVTINFHWFTKDERVDADNICFARKFILDGLVEAKVLANDNRKHVAGFGGDKFSVDRKNPRVEVFIR
jgi:Holliday junction resolvase RusA-like endonuclease